MLQFSWVRQLAEKNKEMRQNVSVARVLLCNIYSIAEKVHNEGSFYTQFACMNAARYLTLNMDYY